MHDDDLRAYVEEIGHQRDLVGLAIHQLNSAIQGLPESSVACFAAAQAILTGAAQISKLLWADTQRDWTAERIAFAHDRAAALRAIVRPSPILQRRSVRNSIEHYDSRLDDLKLGGPPRTEGTSQETWASDDKPDKFVAVIDKSIMDRSQFPIPVPPENITWMRHIDPVTQEYIALDESISLQDVINAIGAVAILADEWLAVRPIRPYASGELGDLSELGL